MPPFLELNLMNFALSGSCSVCSRGVSRTLCCLSSGTVCLVLRIFPILTLLTLDGGGPFSGLWALLGQELSPILSKSLLHIKPTIHPCQMIIHMNEKGTGGMRNSHWRQGSLQWFYAFLIIFEKLLLCVFDAGTSEALQYGCLI